jgi:hypothetical protein
LSGHNLPARTAWILAAALAICFLLSSATAQRSANLILSRSPADTLFVNCDAHHTGKRVLSPVAISQSGRWRAYVEVEIQPGGRCLHSTKLWIGTGNGPYRLVYLMPPKREDAGNGIKILGWAPETGMLLVQTQQWQYGSDAPPVQQVLAINAGSREVYEPDLKVLLQNRKDKECTFQVTDAAFGSERNVILVRAKFFTAVEADETEADVPAGKRCANTQETWSFNQATGEVKQVGGGEPLHIFQKFLANDAR